MKYLPKKGFSICLTILLLMEIIINNTVVHAAELQREITVTHLKDKPVAVSSANVSGSSPGYVHRFLNEPLILDGVDRAHDLYYYVPKAQLGDQNYLELDLSHSELLLPTQSTLTVLVDNQPLQSIFLTEETRQEGKLNIPLNQEEVESGYHKLTLFKHSVVSDDLCSDQYNPANWVKIAPSSFLFLDTKTTWTIEDPLMDFPHPFIEPGTPEEIYSVLILPDAPSPELISAALNVATYLSAQTSSKKHLPILTESEWLKQSSQLTHGIALGSIDAWTGQMKKLIEANQISANNEELVLDFLSIMDNKTDTTKQLMLISGMNDQVIQQKIHTLTDPQLTKQLTGSHLTIEHTPQPSTVVKEQNKQSFSSLGYEHTLLDEVNHTSDQLFFSIPSYWQITGESILELKIKLSPLLQNELLAEPETNQWERNGLTVFINDVPTTISFQDLEPVQEGSDSYIIQIPIAEYVHDLENDGLLRLTFTANISDLGGICYRQRNSGRWVFIDNKSSFHIPHEIIKEHSFQYWPAPFVENKGLDQTALFIPKEINGNLLTQLSLLATELVIDTENQNQITIFQDSTEGTLKEQLKNYNIILLGDIRKYASLQELKDQFLINLENEQLQLADYHVINETTDYVAWIQPSFWNKEKSMAVFQAVGERKGDNQDIDVHPVLLKQLKKEQTESQIAVMTKSGEVFSINLKQNKHNATEDKKIPLPMEAERNQEMPIWLLVLVPVLFVLLFILFILLWRRKRINDGTK